MTFPSLCQCLVLLKELWLYWTAPPTQPRLTGSPAWGPIPTSSKPCPCKVTGPAARRPHCPASSQTCCVAAPTTSLWLLITAFATCQVASHRWKQVGISKHDKKLCNRFKAMFYLIAAFKNIIIDLLGQDFFVISRTTHCIYAWI